MINNEERDRRERNQKEADEERESINGQLSNPKIPIPAIGLEFDFDSLEKSSTPYHLVENR